MDADSIIRKYRLDKRQYTYKGFNGVLHYFYVCGELFNWELQRFLGVSHDFTWIYQTGDKYWHWNYDDTQLEKVREFVLAKARKDPRFLNTLVRYWKGKITLLEKQYRLIDKTDLSRVSDAKLVRMYRDFYDAYLKEYVPSISFHDAFSMHADRFLLPHFRTIISDGFDENFALLMAHTFDTFLMREHIDRLKMLQKGATDARLKAHSRKWHFIHNNYAGEIYLDSGFFRKECANHKGNPSAELKKLAENAKDLKKRKAALMKSLKLDSYSKMLVEMADVVAYMQDERKMHVYKVIHYQHRLMLEIGKRAGYSEAEMELTTPREMEAVLSGAFDRAEISRRAQGLLQINLADSVHIISGPVAGEVYHKVFSKKTLDVAEIKGIVSHPGFVRGKVRILSVREDMKGFKEGEIIVSSMTKPEMTPALRKAAAIVTDEGGVSSHAAVISREFGIPCIIGTKIATKVLRNGDMIEVDAKKGIVRKV